MIAINRIKMRMDIIDVRRKAFCEFRILDFMGFYELMELILKSWIVHGY